MKDLKILIINPVVRVDDKPRNIPHGLAIIASIIRKKLKIEPIFLDANGYRYGWGAIKKEISKIDFDVVLMGGVASAYKFMVELSSFIKQNNPDSKIIVGGYAVMANPEIILMNSFVDIVCVGEGEVTLIDLLMKFRKEGLDTDISDVKGIWYKEKKGDKILSTPPREYIRNLDTESAPPAYDVLPMDIYLSNPVVGIGRDIDMITTRGCPFHCSFCYQPFGNRARYHSVDFIVKTTSYLINYYRIDFISFQDDEFMSDKGRIKEFCEERNKCFPQLLWSCTGRANIISRDESIVKLMRDSGCTLISCGFESGSQRMLNSMSKAQKIEEMEKTVKILRKFGLPVAVSFIIGMPGEDEQSCQETLDFCLRNNIPLDSLMFATPYPGSKIFSFALNTGRIERNNLHAFMMRMGDARDFLINLTDYFSNEELIKKREEMIGITRRNYSKFIDTYGIMEKMKSLYGDLMRKVKLDEQDLMHRAKHGGMSIF